jgi:uncharacterized membrane protein
MKKKNPWGTVILLLVILIPVIYTLTVYPSLPDTIPTHFNLEGKPDAYGNKNNLWFVVLLLSGVSAGVYLLIRNLPKIDPKRTAGQSPEVYHKIALVMVIFLCALNIIIVYSSVNGSITINKLMLPLMGLFFAVLGNYMHSIKPNYFVGFRTPWALENEDNWRKTHQLVGKIWVPGGLLLTITSLLLPFKIGTIVFYIILLVMIIVPAVFSYRYFKKQTQS